MDKFLNFYSKYPWVAIIIVLQWLAAAYIVIYAQEVDITQVMVVTFVQTMLFGYFGFKIPSG